MKTCSIILVVLFYSINYSVCQIPIKLKWGIENEEYFEEGHELIKKESGYTNIPDKLNGKTLRYITPNNKYEELLQQFFSKHNVVWSNFQNTLSKNNNPQRSDFIKYAEKSDPYYLALVDKLAPVLYFDFIGESQEYVLISIEAETLWYGVLKGGAVS